MGHDDLSITERVLKKALSRILMGSDHPYFCFYGKGAMLGTAVVIYRITQEDKNFAFIVADATVKQPLVDVHGTRQWLDQFTSTNEKRYDLYTIDNAYKDFIERIRQQDK